MLDVMELTDVEMFPNSQIFENVFVVVKHEPCHVELGQRFVTVSFEVGIVNEIQDSLDSAQDGDALRLLYARANKKNTNNATKGLYMYGS